MTEITRIVGPPPAHSAKGRRQRRNAFWRRFVCFALLFIVVVFSGVCGYFKLTPKQAFQLISEGGGYLLGKVTKRPAFEGRDQVNILLLGEDESFGQGNGRTDTIKLLHVDLKKQRLAMLAIPRDTWVELPNGRHGRINGAYQLGGRSYEQGAAYAKQAVSGLLTDVSGQPIRIDHYVRVQVGGFLQIVDILGGVEIDVEKDMDYDDPSQDLHIHLKAGRKYLNAYDTMCYVRFRHDKEGDYGRMRRQEQFFRAVAAEIRTERAKERLARNLGKIMEWMRTDIPLGDLAALKNLVDTVGMDGLEASVLPTVPEMEGAASVVKVQDRVMAAQTVNDLLYGPRPTVIVLNGTTQSGLADDVRDVIDAQSFNVVNIGTTREPAETTTVIADPQHHEEASALAARLGVEMVATDVPPPPAKFGRRNTAPDAAEITVVLGRDFPGLPTDTAQAGVW